MHNIVMGFMNLIAILVFWLI